MSIVELRTKKKEEIQNSSNSRPLSTTKLTTKCRSKNIVLNVSWGLFGLLETKRSFRMSVYSSECTLERRLAVKRTDMDKRT